MPRTILHVWDTRKTRENISLFKESLLLEKETIYEIRTRKRDGESRWRQGKQRTRRFAWMEAWGRHSQEAGRWEGSI